MSTTTAASFDQENVIMGGTPVMNARNIKSLVMKNNNTTKNKKLGMNDDTTKTTFKNTGLVSQKSYKVFGGALKDKTNQTPLPSKTSLFKDGVKTATTTNSGTAAKKDFKTNLKPTKSFVIQLDTILNSGGADKTNKTAIASKDSVKKKNANTKKEHRHQKLIQKNGILSVKNKNDGSSIKQHSARKIIGSSTKKLRVKKENSMTQNSKIEQLHSIELIQSLNEEDFPEIEYMPPPVIIDNKYSSPAYDFKLDMYDLHENGVQENNQDFPQFEEESIHVLDNFENENVFESIDIPEIPDILF